MSNQENTDGLEMMNSEVTRLTAERDRANRDALEYRNKWADSEKQLSAAKAERDAIQKAREYICSLTSGEIGGGDVPVDVLIACHRELREQNTITRKECEALHAEIERHIRIEGDLHEDFDRMRKAIASARGSLGYGPLDTLPETIQRVRSILDEALLPSPPRQSEAACIWNGEEEGHWVASCGGDFALTEGNPKKNDMDFCCFCGKKIGATEDGRTRRLPHPEGESRAGEAVIWNWHRTAAIPFKVVEFMSRLSLRQRILAKVTAVTPSEILIFFPGKHPDAKANSQVARGKTQGDSGMRVVECPACRELILTGHLCIPTRQNKLKNK